MISFFFKRKPKVYGEIIPITADMHSHILPGIDDGCDTFEQSVELVKKFIAKGYKKLIATPHIMSDFYRNTPEIIHEKADQLRDIIQTEGLNIEIEAAAEYYIDEGFIKKLEQGEKLLSFGSKKYVLFETSYINPSPYFKYVVFALKTQGYIPVLAHPERYVYLFDDFKTLEEMYESGVLLQININSLAGYYSKHAQHLAEKLIERQMIAFAGSDCHNIRHAQVMEGAMKLPYYQSALSVGLLNNTLLT
jgi:tyrosine-protein phosphatase YwqE